VSVKFFGQFLIQAGAITADQLRQALDLMERTNTPLGQLAVRVGYLSEEAVDTFSYEEAATGQPFAELVADLGVLSPRQLDDLLTQQAGLRLGLGDALLALGFLKPPALAAHRQTFEADQAPYRIGPAAVPPKLSSHRPSHVVVDFVPKLAASMAGVQVKVVLAEDHDALATLPYRASVVARGSFPFRVELGADRGLATALARGLVRDPRLEPTEPELTESVAELLNVVVGNAIALLENDGIHLSLFPPEFGAARCEGVAFDLVTPDGLGSLFIDPNPELPRLSVELDEGVYPWR
jgi:hypothetical protein